MSKKDIEDVIKYYLKNPLGSPEEISMAFRSRQFAGIALLFAGFLVIALASGIGAETAEFAPDFTVTDTDGETFKLSEFRDKKMVLIDVMYEACENCKIVEKSLKNLYPEWKDKVEFISIDSVDNMDIVRNYKKTHNVPWRMAPDDQNIMLTKYNINSAPTIIIVDIEGYATFKQSAIVAEQEIENQLELAYKGEAQRITISPVSVYALAIFAGVASFFSPCAFPMFPGYMSFYMNKHMESGEKPTGKKAAASGSIAALGIIIVYVISGVLILGGASFVTPYIGALQLLVGIILVILGLLMLTEIQYYSIIRPFQNLFAKLKQKKEDEDEEVRKEKGFYAGLFAYGIGYGSAAAGCTLPVFLGVILAAMTSGTLLNGILVLIIYTAVAAALMVVVTVAVAIVGLPALQKLSQRTNAIKKTSGVVLFLAGLYLTFFWAAAHGIQEFMWVSTLFSWPFLDLLDLANRTVCFVDVALLLLVIYVFYARKDERKARGL
jgi:cytochrome c-type biogenesis protein